MKVLLSLLFGCLLLTGSSQQPGLPQKALRQGIQGTVVLRTGNHMPGPGKRFSPPQHPVAREILVYPLTNLSRVKTQGPFFIPLSSKPVARVRSGQDGSFRLFLPPGKYSLLSKEAEGLFANRFDGDNNIFPVEVKPGQVTPVEFIIDYKASY
jgi:hypothetical protein